MTFHFIPSGPVRAEVMNLVRMSASVRAFLFIDREPESVDCARFRRHCTRFWNAAEAKSLEMRQGWAEAGDGLPHRGGGPLSVGGRISLFECGVFCRLVLIAKSFEFLRAKSVFNFEGCLIPGPVKELFRDHDCDIFFPKCGFDVRALGENGLADEFIEGAVCGFFRLELSEGFDFFSEG